MAKAPDPNRLARQKMAKEAPPTIRWDGKSYAVRPGEIRARQDMEIRQATGRTFVEHMSDLYGGSPAMDTAAVFLWLARTQAGEDVTLDATLDEVGIDALMELFAEQEGEVVDPPT